MDTEQILFIIIALALSIFSMYIKSKKQKQKISFPETDEYSPDLMQEQYLKKEEDEDIFFEQIYVTKTTQNSNNYAKQRKKIQKPQIIETEKKSVNQIEDKTQTADLDIETEFLDHFEGTSLQKAFLYGEIFKNVKN